MRERGVEEPVGQGGVEELLRKKKKELKRTC
jgi:hypothetical protein